MAISGLYYDEANDWREPSARLCRCSLRSTDVRWSSSSNRT